MIFENSFFIKQNKDETRKINLPYIKCSVSVPIFNKKADNYNEYANNTNNESDIIILYLYLIYYILVEIVVGIYINLECFFSFFN